VVGRRGGGCGKAVVVVERKEKHRQGEVLRERGKDG